MSCGVIGGGQRGVGWEEDREVSGVYLLCALESTFLVVEVCEDDVQHLGGGREEDEDID